MRRFHAHRLPHKTNQALRTIRGWGVYGYCSTDVGERDSGVPGKPVVVVNKPGAAGSICFDFVRKEKVDGYSMMMDPIGATVLYASMNTKLPFSFEQHTYIARVEVLSNALVVNPNLLTRDEISPHGAFTYNICLVQVGKI